MVSTNNINVGLAKKYNTDEESEHAKNVLTYNAYSGITMYSWDDYELNSDASSNVEQDFVKDFDSDIE